MDPGTALGVASLALDLFDKCVQGFFLLIEAHNFGKVGNGLIIRLSQLELRLTNWAENVGLLQTGKLDPRLNVAVIEEFLTHLASTLSDIDSLSSRYHFKLAADPPADVKKELETKAISSLSLDTRSPVCSAISEQTRNSMRIRAKALHKLNPLPKRLWWAYCDQDKFRELVNTVRDMVEDLEAMLPTLQFKDLILFHERIERRLIAQSEDLEDLKAIKQALSDKRTSQQRLPLGNERLEFHTRSLLSAAEVKTERLQLQRSTDNNTNGEPDGDLVPGRLAPLSVDHLTSQKPLTYSKEICTALYNNEPVLVEWQPFHHPDSKIRTQLMRRNEILALLLHAEKHEAFRSLRCRGIAHDPALEKIAFIFDFPPDPSPSTATISLRELLSAKQLAPPSVSDRIALALAVTRSIRMFHTTGWLHKNIRSENILFFTSDTQRNKYQSIPFSTPVLVGFANARQDAPGGISVQYEVESENALLRDIYRHPESFGFSDLRYRDSVFEPGMDLYALGTVLVEIAEWKPLSRLLAKDVVDVHEVWKESDRCLSRGQVVDTVERVHAFLLKCIGKYDNDEMRRSSTSIQVGFRMGEIYRKVCAWCLVGRKPPFGNLHGITNDDFEIMSSLSLDVVENATALLESCII
ncbi:hypothetical protein K461DRAFT_298421 [Myriangium duriaei CBS 260.36]|uniref:Protein kinase domain-containing protein n=1 Tax=Myriangium duriaei CBS 260.36 TaxID=1168546 RepID=A0A9P4MHE8_9PEZI|nr:hypothetical protein K461DRAFT_298421 [Myriangium duriaei CBS 260.36]